MSNEIIYSTFILAVSAIMLLSVFVWIPEGIEPVTDDNLYERSTADEAAMLLGGLVVGIVGLLYFMYPYIVGAF